MQVSSCAYFKRIFACQQLVGQDSNSPNIYSLIVFLLAHQLGSQVEWGSALSVPHRLVAEEDRPPEVPNFDNVPLRSPVKYHGEEDIFRLYVPVHQIVTMHTFDR